MNNIFHNRKAHGHWPFHGFAPPRWPSGKASASRTADLGSVPPFVVDLFQVEGLFSPVSVYCERVRQKV